VRNIEAQTKLANQQDHNRYEDGRNCGDGECSFVFLIADALRPRNGQPCRSYRIQLKLFALDRAAHVGRGRRAAVARAKALGTNPNLVTLVQTERWNGVLPTTMVPGSSVPFVSLK
jgi:hypothetical protein